MFGAEDGTIGAGCIRELADAIALGIPVAGFEIRGGLREISGFDLIETGRRNLRRAATLRLGRCVQGAAWRQRGTTGRGQKSGAAR